MIEKQLGKKTAAPSLWFCKIWAVKEKSSPFHPHVIFHKESLREFEKEGKHHPHSFCKFALSTTTQLGFQIHRLPFSCQTRQGGFRKQEKEKEKEPPFPPYFN